MLEPNIEQPPRRPIRNKNNNDNPYHSIPVTIPTDSAAAARGYSMSGRIMLTAVVLLFFFVLLMLSLHLYARWYLTRARRRHIIRRNLRRRRTNIVFYLPDSPTTAAALTRGLDAALIASLPVFTYDPKTRPENAQDCAVCLSEFEPGESGRVLPKCKHSFHTDCIDMWFHSHATCPLCRAPVEPQLPESESRSEVVITVSGPDTGSSSGSGGYRTGNEMRKPFPVTVEVPARGGESFHRDDSGRDSPSSFRSPVSRMLSFKRMLSRERKGSVSPSSGGGVGGGGCSSSAELGDAERGETR